MVEREAWRKGESVIVYPIANEEEREFPDQGEAAGRG